MMVGVHAGWQGSQPSAEAVPLEAGAARLLGAGRPAVCHQQPGTALCSARPCLAALCEEGQQQHHAHHLHPISR